MKNKWKVVLGNTTKLIKTKENKEKSLTQLEKKKTNERLWELELQKNQNQSSTLRAAENIDQ